MITKWITSDGEEFTTKYDAYEHEKENMALDDYAEHLQKNNVSYTDLLEVILDYRGDLPYGLDGKLKLCEEKYCEGNIEEVEEED